MRRLTMVGLVALLLAGGVAAQDLDHVRKAHLWPALLAVPGGTDLGDTWTCASGSTTCNADTGAPPAQADTVLAGSEIVWCSDGSHWYSYTVDGDPSAEDTWERTQVYPDGTVDSLRALTGVSCIALVGIGATATGVIDGAGTTSPLSIDTSTVHAAALEVGGGAGGSGSTASADGSILADLWIAGPLRVITQTATDTLTAAEVSGTQVSNYGQLAANTQTLPAAASGLNFTVVVGTAGAGAVNIKAGASDKIYLDGTALDDGDKASCATPAVGDSLYCVAFQTGASAYDWMCNTVTGTWIDGGA